MSSNTPCRLPRRPEELILGPRQTKICAQGGPLLCAAEEAPALQLGDDQRHEIIEAGRHGREHDAEPVAGIDLQLRLHHVGDLNSGSDHFEPAEATDQLGKLTDGQVLPACQRDKRIAPALALV